MARTYAATLGLVAFVTTVARSWLHGASPTQALFAAWLSLLAFTAIGAVLGGLAGWIVDDAVRSRFADEFDKKL